MNKNVLKTENLLLQIKKIVFNSRTKITKTINKESLLMYWSIGKTIIENEQDGRIRAEYGKQVLLDLAKKLTRELGKGFSRSNLQNMRLFYLNYPNYQTLSGKLSWSHYCELISIDDKKLENELEI